MLSYLQIILNKLHALYPDKPQECLVIDKALREVETGLQVLSRLGHVYHLAVGPCPDEIANAWGPRVYWHADGRCKECWHPRDLEELGEGWAETFEKAKLLQGMAQQFAGRGGVRSGNLPAVMSELWVQLASPADREADRKARIAAWKKEKENATG